MDPAGAYAHGAEALNRLRSLEGRIVASLAAVAEWIETAVGLPGLPDPPPRTDAAPTGPDGAVDRTE
jgi:hypothetical protein